VEEQQMVEGSISLAVDLGVQLAEGLQSVDKQLHSWVYNVDLHLFSRKVLQQFKKYLDLASGHNNSLSYIVGHL
jgi:hypothetical protein